MKSRSQNRTNEYIATIQHNINHKHVRYVYILEESWTERAVYKLSLRDPLHKVIFLPFGRQPNYSDIFHLVTHYIEPRREVGEVWMVSNADIILGEGFHVLRGHLNNRTLLGLSRHPSRICKEPYNQCLRYIGSSDSFIGSGPVEEGIISNLNFRQNSYGAENVVLFEFRKARYRLLNPCGDIKTYHNHCSDFRTGPIYRINNHGRSVWLTPSRWNISMTEKSDKKRPSNTRLV